MGAARDITGMVFGRLTAVTRQYGPRSGGPRLWVFRCDCGATIARTVNAVSTGKTRSCGCLRRESAAGKAKMAGDARGAQMMRHGKAGTMPEYAVWKSMRQRCSNPRVKDYPAYGGRGIQVCEQWNSFEVFLHDMGARPSSQHSIDRIDSNGNYEPSNCRWADDFTQAGNRRQRGTGEYAARKH